VLYPRKRADAKVRSLCDRLGIFTQAVLLSGQIPYSATHVADIRQSS
jgi:hypothetical protein